MKSFKSFCLDKISQNVNKSTTSIIINVILFIMTTSLAELQCDTTVSGLALPGPPLPPTLSLVLLEVKGEFFLSAVANARPLWEPLG